MNLFLAYRYLVWIVIFMAAGLLEAANPNGNLRIQMLTGPNAVVDSNAGASPHAFYVNAKIWNDGPVDLAGVSVYIGSFGNGTNRTPGLYPARNHLTLKGPLSGNKFALTHEGGSMGTGDASRYVGTIKAGQSASVFWLVSYPVKDLDGNPVIGSSNDLSDDLWLNYDIWATIGSGPGAVTADQTGKVTMRSEISSFANKIYPNTANQVPAEYKTLLNAYAPAWTNILIDGSVGSEIDIEGIWYDLGNVGSGIDADGDLVPDSDVCLQPVGNPSMFDAGAFRLVATDVLVIINLVSGGTQAISARDQLYFKDLPPNNGVVGFVRYQFVPLKSSSLSQLTPYQQAASGSSIKYNSDYGAILGTTLISAPEPSATLTKRAGVSAASAGGVIPYSITVTNNGTVNIGRPEEGVPIVIQDRIPSGSSYIAGSASVSNVPPPGMGSYAILYSTNNAASWITSEPSSASAVTDIQWWMTTPLEPGQTGTVRFSVQISNPYSQAPVLLNTAGLSMGNTASFATSTARTFVNGNNTFGGVVYSDDGSGGGLLGNQIRELSEPGLSLVGVRLYYDINTNGVLDASDLYVSSADSTVGGAYLFTNLVDGAYVAVVDTSDPDVPVGYMTPVTNAYHFALDPSRTNANAVSVLTGDFGFVPALGLSKHLTSTGPAYEGRPVSYTITVTNNMVGNGSGGGAPVAYTVWGGTLEYSDTGWSNPSNAVGPANGVYSDNSFSTAKKDVLSVTGYNLSGTTGSIARVQLLVPILVTPSWPAATFNVVLSTRGSPKNIEFFRKNYTGDSSLSTGMLVFDVTTNRTWQWTDFTTNNVIISVEAEKSGSPTGSIGVDAAGFQVTSTATQGGSSSSTTISDLPLVDTFDTRLLQLVSAVPMYSSMVTNGSTGVIRWDNLGPLYPGGSKAVTVSYKGLEPPANTATMVTNAVAVTNALFSDGRPVNQAASQAVTNLIPTGVIGQYVWRDQNGNGQTNASETGIANVKVVLRPPVDVDAGAGAGVWITNTTDSAGYYLFSGLISTGRYVVAVLTSSLPNGGVGVTNTWTELNGTFNPTNVTVVTNLYPTATDGSDKHLSANFGYAWGGATITGSVWDDVNRSGTPTPDSGEYGLTNVTVYLYSSTNSANPVATNKTDSAGLFSFTGSYSGNYYVQVATNTGPLSGGTTWIPTFDTDGILTTGRVTVTVASGVSTNVAFSYYRTGPYAIGDTVYYDWNGDGLLSSSDEGIPFVPVSLYWDSNSNGVVNAGSDVLLAVTHTDQQGHYLFSNYPPNNYLVVVDSASTNLPGLFLLTGDPYGPKDGISLVTLTSTNNLEQDFGYQPVGSGVIGDRVWRDLDADGLQNGLLETGVSNVTVRLYADMNQDGLFVQVASTTTLADGQYAFGSLPDGQYKVIVDAAGSGIPKDAYNVTYVPTTPTNVLVTISGGNSVLTADFGFAALGSLGDTIFFDNNANGGQDPNEGGITNVTVNLYRDDNTNRLYDAGDTLLRTSQTGTNGLYLFTALAQGHYIVVVDTNSTPLLNTKLTAAPGLDGEPLTNSSMQSVYTQYALTIQHGSVFMIADFGFQPPGVIGETVWIDANGNGTRETNERGIPNIAMVLSNATMTVTNRTDLDGYYSFNGLLDGPYTLRVITDDGQLPAGLSPTYDPDGTNTANRVNGIAITNGHIVAVNGMVKTNFDLRINFGYQYVGTNTVSGTLGMDGPELDGRLGTGTSGVSTNERPFVNHTVYLNIWHDSNSNGVVDVSELVAFSAMQTDAQGDYIFTQVPSSMGSGTNRYIVSLSAPAEHLVLTTVTGSTPALSVVASTNSEGAILSAYQVVAVNATITNIDFAFRDAWLYDFGDLPSSYGTVLADGGAQNRVLPVPDLYLGPTVTTEADGKPSVSASLDTGDDGVSSMGVWQNGPTGAVLQVSVGKGAGWLVGYIDFNGNGNFLDAGDLVLSQSVSTNGGNGSGVYSFPVEVPLASISATNTTTLYSRFRLLPSEPAFPELAFEGVAVNGETEDYRWDLGAVGDRVWTDLNNNGVLDVGEPPLAGVRVYVDLNSNGVWNVDEPYSVTDANGHYGIGGFPGSSFVIAVDTNSLPAGAVATYDLDSVPFNRVAVTLSAGQVLASVDFGYIFPADVSGYVRVDMNGNGIIDAGDTNGIAGVSVQLLDTNDTVIATSPTGVNGGYIFASVMPGDYTVKELDGAGYFSTKDMQGANDNRILVTVVSGTPNTDNTFYDTSYATVGDRVWNDLNGDGAQDADEPGLTNVTVRLLNVSSNLLGTAVTDASGMYLFTNLLPATYLIHVIAPTQFVFTVRDAVVTNDLGDSDADASGWLAPITLVSGQIDRARDAGLYIGARIYGYVYQDLNTNLVRTAYVDYPVANMNVTLWRAGVQVASTVTASDGSGRYAFNMLEAGDYTVRFSGSTNLLEAVPLSGAASTDPERNRATVDGSGNIFANTAVVPGQGVLFPTEPINAGFLNPPRPLSESVALRAYSGQDGVYVEFATSSEAGYGLISVAVWANGEWQVLGILPAVGYGSNTYSFRAPGLEVGKRYYFQVEDEVGYLYDLYDVEVTPFALQLEIMQRAGIRLRWQSIPGRSYQIYTTKQLGDSWTFIETVMADSLRACLDVKVDPIDRQRFFKIVMVRDDVIE